MIVTEIGFRNIGYQLQGGHTLISLIEDKKACHIFSGLKELVQRFVFVAYIEKWLNLYSRAALAELLRICSTASKVVVAEFPRLNSTALIDVF